MSINKKIYDTSSDLLVKQVGHGITLVKPDRFQRQESTLLSHSIKDILNIPVAVYFDNLDHCSVCCNEITVEECGFVSMKEFIGDHWFRAFDDSRVAIALNHDRSVVSENQSKIFEEKGWRKDGVYVHTLSFRMPWYDNSGNVIGLFGFSIVLGKHSLVEALVRIMELGFLNSTALLKIGKKQENYEKIMQANLTHRESECFDLLLTGMSTKEIGKTLKISFRTVEKYQANLLEKLKCKNKYELMGQFVGSCR